MSNKAVLKLFGLIAPSTSNLSKLFGIWISIAKHISYTKWKYKFNTFGFAPFFPLSEKGTFSLKYSRRRFSLTESDSLSDKKDFSVEKNIETLEKWEQKLKCGIFTFHLSRYIFDRRLTTDGMSHAGRRHRVFLSIPNLPSAVSLSSISSSRLSLLL